MVFSSTEFLFIFLPIVLIVYFNPFFKGRNFRNYVLLAASLFFYAWGEPFFVIVMLFSIVLNWLFALLIDKQTAHNKRKWLLLPPILFDILLIFLFKYLNFTAKNIGFLLGRDIELNIALPIGISFFTFQIMSYVLDVYYRKADAQKNVLNVALYISLFPQLIAGPIVRYKTIADQLTNRIESRANFTNGVIRFIIGLGKKVLIANYVAVIADNIFVLNGDISVTTAWLGIIAYALQIYFDFSGYSDMAIGLGLIFGFEFEENFNFPYIARSITDFWRRWHISLSSWFRDYVYIPLGGNRVSKKRWILNLFVVWLLTGIWHGANWTFIIWGLYYFMFLLLEKLIGNEKKNTWYSHLYTILIVLIGWVIFRSENLPSAIQYVGIMFGIGAKSFSDKFFVYYLLGGKWVLFAGILFSLPIRKYVRRISENLRARQDKWAILGHPKILTAIKIILVVIIFFLSILTVINSTHNPFIYFNF